MTKKPARAVGPARAGKSVGRLLRPGHTAGVKMKNGRALNTLVETYGRWPADAVRFK